VLTWNLFHGRAVPPAGRDLLGEFSAALCRWQWDVALLQEVPPWWPGALALATGSQERSVLTSRNAGLAVRRAVATRWPDALKSNGGGCNAILVRGSAGPISAHRARRLGVWPERRWLHGVRVPAGWVCNVHTGAFAEQGIGAARVALSWAEGAGGVVLGGDFNLEDLVLEGFEHAGGFGVDHVYVRGLRAAGPAEVLVHGALSDHAPVVVTVTSGGATGGGAGGAGGAGGGG
jgi:endonuclease/exonuclease/phosphatase family metal-dependent hydrolase